ncbi:uncharacterized protein J4E84_005642 [Alternaria hordeiaustralica]|uniref:uncharacterized protein n=1 Tax=Alternaria hordeiaustralica TaxID=1187925 RepID=UPI0020C1F3EB|nr:uncharacterized protein J4E84_005642 [Alternaria hordeiaustralica]KAI4686365.1 hypothetical protein J4E84_005642 [Alternaria hordeiaustralica]
MATPDQAQKQKSKKIARKIAKQYQSKDFKYPETWDPSDAKDFRAIRERMFAKREKLRWKEIDITASTDPKNNTGDKGKAPVAKEPVHPDDKFTDEGDLLEDALQDAVKQEQFWLWVHAEDEKIRMAPEVGTAEDYIRALSETNYADDASFKKLRQRQSAYFCPSIPIGTHEDYRYAVSPCLAVMEPDDAIVFYDDPRKFAREGVIGINIPSGNRIKYTDLKQETWIRRGGSDGSNGSSFSDSSIESMVVQGNSLTGFVCLQIGQVHAVAAKHWSDSDDVPWKETDWVMVVVINDDGNPGSVWLLQDFEPMIKDTNDTYIIEQSDTSEWGYFQHQLDMRPHPQQRAGVKIAHHVSDLSENFQWTMDEYFTTKYEIVRAVIAVRELDRSSVIVRQLGKPKENRSMGWSLTSGSTVDRSTPDISSLNIWDTN